MERDGIVVAVVTMDLGGLGGVPTGCRMSKVRVQGPL